MLRRLGVATVTIALAGCATRPSGPPATAPTAATANTPELPFGSSADADTLLTDVRALEPTIVVSMRYATPSNFTGAPLPGYDANRALLRREAAAALARVQRALADSGLSLQVWDAYRPVRATLAMVEWTRRAGREDLLRDGYIASRSRHNLGLAVDLTLVSRATGAELDMGTPFDTFTSDAHTANATGERALNRHRLVRAMESQGFVNYDQEWWHFGFSAPRPLRFDVPIASVR